MNIWLDIVAPKRVGQEEAGANRSDGSRITETPLETNCKYRDNEGWNKLLY
jgi:hypothetical protein